MAEGWLTGWKDIAAYVGLHIRTCKRYKKKYSLPVRSLPADKRGKPIALKYELDQWLIDFSNIKNKLSR